MQQPFVMGWPLFSAQYWVIIENEVTDDTIDIHCVGGATKFKDLGLYHIPVNSNFNWTFHSSFLFVTQYNCLLTSPDLGWQIEIRAFADEPKFVDKSCGGRHCFWSARDEGIFLYNIKEKKYHFIGDWGEL